MKQENIQGNIQGNIHSTLESKGDCEKNKNSSPSPSSVKINNLSKGLLSDNLNKGLLSDSFSKDYRWNKPNPRVRGLKALTGLTQVNPDVRGLSFEQGNNQVNTLIEDKITKGYKINKKWSKGLASGLLMTLIIVTSSLIPNTGVKATTVDDLRELSNQERLSERYTAKQIAEISAKYKSLNDNNKVAKYFDLDEVKRQNKIIKSKLKEQNKTIEVKSEQLKTRISQDIQPTEVIDLLEGVRKEVDKLETLEQPQAELSVRYKKNTYEEAYKDVLATLAELESYKNIGYLGKELHSPVITKDNFERFNIQAPFGYRHGKKDLKVTSKVYLNKGIDLAVSKSDKIRTLWEGKITSIKEQADGYEIQVASHKNLRVIYRGIKNPPSSVSVNKTIKDKAYIGKGNGNKLHLEIILDNKATNPIYFFGRGKGEILRNYILENPKDEYIVKMSNLIPLIKDSTKARIKILAKREKLESEMEKKGQYWGDKNKQMKKADKGEVQAYLKEGYDKPSPTGGIAKLGDNSEQKGSKGATNGTEASKESIKNEEGN